MKKNILNIYLNVHIFAFFLLTYFALISHGYPKYNKEYMVARYGGPMVLKPQVATWSRIMIGKNFIGDKWLSFGPWEFTNIDVEDPLLIEGSDDYDILIGTGLIKNSEGEVNDLRHLYITNFNNALDSLNSKHQVVRARGVWALGEIGNKQAIPFLLKAINDDSWVVRRYALLSLSQIADTSQTIPMAIELIHDESDIVIKLAVNILIENGIKDKRFANALLQQIYNEDWTISNIAIDALGEIGDDSILKTLQDILEKNNVQNKSSIESAIEKIKSRLPKLRIGSILPAYLQPLLGHNEVRVRNPNNYFVMVGLRQGIKGIDFPVPSEGVASVLVPDGKYDIYFVYFNELDALFQGDSFVLNGNGVEIRLIKVVDGNYGIKRVK